MISPESFRRYLLDRLVLRPSRDQLDCGSQQRITYPDGGRTMEYFSQPWGAAGAKPPLLVLKFPGTAGRAERSSAFPIPLMDEAHGIVLTWNPPGYGNSDGKATLAKIAASAKVFFQHAIEQYAEPESIIWLCGNSLGCTTVLHLASWIEGDDFAGKDSDHDQAFRSIDGIVLRNPPALVSVVKNIASNYPMGRYIHRVAESLIDEMNAEFTAPKISTPAVFLQSMADTLVLPELQNQIIDRYAGLKQLVPMDGLNHDGIPTEEHEDLIRESLHWLWSQAKRA